VRLVRNFTISASESWFLRRCFSWCVVMAAVLLVLVLAVPVAAEAPTYKGYPVVHVMVNGKAIVVGQVPAIDMDGRTFVPVKDVAESLGATVSFDASSNTVSIQGADVAGLRTQLAQLQAQTDPPNGCIVLQASGDHGNGRPVARAPSPGACSRRPISEPTAALHVRC